MDIRAKWIWADKAAQADQYADFADSFVYAGGEICLEISADSNYAVWLNGNYVYSGQYPDFPHDKVYDAIDIAPFCRAGENRLCVTVWHYGKGNMGYFPGKAALRYAVKQGEALLCASGEGTLSRVSPAYQNGLCKTITGQLGFSFKYDLTREDEWLAKTADGFAKSRIVEQELPMRLRPVKLCRVDGPAPSVCIKKEEDRHFLYDIGREEAGFLDIEIESAEEQDILIAYGEHIADGGVRRRIGSRDFSVELRLKKGQNRYMNPFRRLGLRYLELFAEKGVRVGRLTVRPVGYPVEEAGNRPCMDEMQTKIYDACLRTLRMCMHEHYEDTPWREQALYAMDGRNQMLCGYYAFGEYAFARANLLLMSRDDRVDRLLSICTPSSDDLTIPSFSLHYFAEIAEYTRYSGDCTLARDVWPKLQSVLSAFSDRAEGGLVPVFTEKCHWNFYEWSEGLSGTLHAAEEKRFDAALSCLYATALRNMQFVAEAIGEKGAYSAQADETARAVREKFYDENRGVFVNSTKDAAASELVNALAVLCGAAKGKEAERIAGLLAQQENGLTGATLSMLCFKYDALLAVDAEKYRGYILSDIANRYSRMLASGATTFWETEKGEADFDRAGSLCHGWSAMPVYYYHLLL